MAKQYKPESLFVAPYATARTPVVKLRRSKAEPESLKESQNMAKFFQTFGLFLLSDFSDL